MCRWKYFCFPGLLFLCSVFFASAQNDSAYKPGIDSFLLRQKGIFGNLARNLLVDTGRRAEPQRNDEPFQPYKDLIIRNISVQPLPFGISIGDTSKKINNWLTRLANKFHRQTRVHVIRNNLFFREGGKLSPFLMGDNERHMRDLLFIQDARFKAQPVGADSVDIIIITKDVLSVGGNLVVYNAASAGFTLKEDNFYGWGDQVQAQFLFDRNRKGKLGYGVGYLKRNIGGSFIDASAGYLNFNPSFSSFKREEQVGYFRLVRPLVNRFMQLTYGAELEMHNAKNLYNEDSLYQSNLKYKYGIMDGWAAWNIDAGRSNVPGKDDRVRRLIGARILQQKFTQRPLQFLLQNIYRYADVSALLGEIGIFRQNFYKSQYIYGFGRNEDVPEGVEASVTAGWTKKAAIPRAYAGLNFQRYFFSDSSGRYFNYTARLGGYLRNNKFEDISLLGSLDYFSPLHQLNVWKQRSFIGISIARQFKRLFDEPLFIESDYGLPEFRNNEQGGDVRISLKTESVFYSPWSLLLFRFAPFVFTDVSVFHQQFETGYDKKIYSSLGGGVRTRNESLIFGTIELRAMYFPRRNFFDQHWKISVSTNVRFKYNQEFIKRPEFVSAN